MTIRVRPVVVVAVMAAIGTSCIRTSPFKEGSQTGADSGIATDGGTTGPGPNWLAAMGSLNMVELVWNAVSSATGYAVMRATAAGGPYTQIAAPTQTEYSDSGLAAGTTYYYVVAALSPAGRSDNSVEASALTLPAAPTVFSAIANPTSVSINWTTAWSATSYVVARGVYPAAPVDIGDASTTVFSDTSFAPGTWYYYVVRAQNATGAGPNSLEAQVLTRPAAPSGIIAAGGDTSIALSWDASVSATSYVVYRNIVSGEPYAQRGATSAPTFTDTGLIAGSSYFYVVMAVNDGGEGLFSNEVVALTRPPAPTDLVTTGGNPLVGLTWDASVSATSYSIYRRDADGGVFVDAGTTILPVFSDPNGSPGVTNTYIVRASNSSGEGPASAEASRLTVPAAPAGLVATPSDARVSLTWLATIGATSYEVHRAVDAGGPFTSLDASASTLYNDTGLTNGQPYFYAVRAANDAGVGPFCTAVSATPSSSLRCETPVALPSALDGSVSSAPQVATGPNGDALVAWELTEPGGTHKIVTARYVASDGWPAGWRTPEILEPSGEVQRNPVVAIDSAGYATIVRLFGALNEVWSIRIAPDGGWTTASPVMISDSLENGQAPKVVVDGWGRVTAVWAKAMPKVSRAARFDPDAGWSAPVTLTDAAVSNLNVIKPVVDSAGNTMVIGSRSGPSDQIWANRYVPGQGWQGELWIDGNTAPAGAVSAAGDPDGNVAVFFSDVGGQLVESNRFEPDAGWGDAGPVASTDGGLLYDTAAAATPNGSIHVAWIANFFSPNYSVVGSASFIDAGWGPSTTIHTASGISSQSLSLATSPTGRATILWSETIAGLGRILISSYILDTEGSGRWDDAGTVDIPNPDAGSALFPSMAIDPFGNVVVVWSVGNSTTWASLCR
ncbi:MAG: hypothetical protein HYY84_03260 [Deltaproteobacteria bacterium]|nr:hypothetical protein [Deltaproteobacteria bacterium]